MFNKLQTKHKKTNKMQKNKIQFLITLEVFTKYHKACELLLSFLDWGNGAAGNTERFLEVSTHALRRTTP